MDKKEIIQALKLTGQLLELHGENQFKTKSYTSAVYGLERFKGKVKGASIDKLQEIEGVGKSIAEKIDSISKTGSFKELDALLAATPPGVVKMLNIKGLGPKRLRTLWQTLKIENINDLMKACEAGQVARLKGFGPKTETTIKNILEFTLANEGAVHYRTAEPIANDLLEKLQLNPAFDKVVLTGEMALRRDTLKDITFVIAYSNLDKAVEELNKMEEFVCDDKKCGPFAWRGHTKKGGMSVCIRLVKPEEFANKAYEWSATSAHLQLPLPDGGTIGQLLRKEKFESEEAIFNKAGIQAIPNELREGFWEMEWATEGKIPELLEYKDIKGALHNHSTYSDGRHTLREMVEKCQDIGLEYFGISDHSKAAFYANGLDEDRVRKQWEEIDALNKEVALFRIFKGIESDILNDGSLDYPDDVLAGFDFVVASVHSNQDMDVDKATERLITAIKNPYTTILGHPTARMLLKRKGYPLHMHEVIDACAEHNVIIEINANPWRLDLDWRYVRYALDKGVILSINPDAHFQHEIENMRFGVIVGRKGGLSAAETFNTRSADEVADYFQKRKAAIKSKAKA